MIWFLVGIIIFTYIFNKITLDYGFRNLRYSMEVVKDIAEIGEEIELLSIIENNKPLTVSFLKVQEIFPKGFNLKENIYTLFIMPYQRVRRTYKVAGEERGLYRIKEVHLELGDFIGFNKSHEELEIKKELVILPRKIELEKEIAPIGSLMGDITVKRWIINDPLMTIGIREYTGNEPERFIHWPSSLKYGDLMVKDFDFTTDNSVMVVLNLESSKPYWMDIDQVEIEKCISIARGIMEECEELKVPYGFVSNAYNASSDYIKGHFHHPGLGPNHLRNFLETLGRMNYVISSIFEDTLRDISRRQGDYSTIVVITPKLLESYINPLNSLSRAVAMTVVISVDGENMEGLNKNIIAYRGVENDQHSIT